jgi:hypothetical protein
MKHQSFKTAEDEENIYDFVCEGCKSEVVIGVPKDLKRFNCPESCGASYLQWSNSGVPTITCVICPIFEEEL